MVYISSQNNIQYVFQVQIKISTAFFEIVIQPTSTKAFRAIVGSIKRNVIFFRYACCFGVYKIINVFVPFNPRMPFGPLKANFFEP